MSALPTKADISSASVHVGYGPIADIGAPTTEPMKLIVLSSCNVPVLAIMSSEDLDARSIRGHDWQQQKCFVFWPSVYRRIAPKDLFGTVITIIVQPWSGAT